MHLIFENFDGIHVFVYNILVGKKFPRRTATTATRISTTEQDWARLQYERRKTVQEPLRLPHALARLSTTEHDWARLQYECSTTDHDSVDRPRLQHDSFEHFKTVVGAPRLATTEQDSIRMHKTAARLQHDLTRLQYDWGRMPKIMTVVLSRGRQSCRWDWGIIYRQNYTYM